LKLLRAIALTLALLDLAGYTYLLLAWRETRPCAGFYRD
jgi:hypothetical protein